MEINIILFYKFVKIENPKLLREQHLDFCKKLGVYGRILIAKEGINGSVSGNANQIENYKSWLLGQDLFERMEFKEEKGLHHPFDRLIVKVKKEIIRIDRKLNMDKVGRHISPDEFFNLYENEDIVFLDTRNKYEIDAGKFGKAINPEINSFREFPNFVNNLNISKNTPIVMYCTGGIRCEKASSYMIQEGFTNVSQLHGGIINFCQNLPNTIWKGSCFVFDKRLTSNVGQKESSINSCIHCKTLCDQYRRCKNKSCDILVFVCPKCQKDYHNCCSKECKKELLNGKN